MGRAVHRRPRSATGRCTASCPQVASPRAEVANTIRYRRRKGTVSVLEQLAADVTGWPAHAVEFFELLVATQYMNHVRPHAAATTDLRSESRLELSGTFQAGAFDTFAHTAEMRRIAVAIRALQHPERRHLPLARRRRSGSSASPLVDADGAGTRFRFDPLGTDKPLFNAPRTEQDDHAPRRAARRARCRCGAASRSRTCGELYGAGRSLLLETETATGVDAGRQSPTSASATSPTTPPRPGRGRTQPQPGDTHVAVDPVLGRVAFAAAPAAGETRLATFHYGSALAVGGGGYDRAQSLDRMHTVVPVERRRPAGASARVRRRRRRGADPRQPDVRRAGDDHRDDAGAERRRPRPRAPLGQPRAARAHAHATSSSSRWIRTRRSCSTAWCSRAAPLVIEESADAEPRRLVLRHCTLVPGVTRDPDGEPALGRPREPDRPAPVRGGDARPLHRRPGRRRRGRRGRRRTTRSFDASAEDEIAFCGRAPAGGGGLLHGLDRRRPRDGRRARAEGGSPDARRLHGARQGARPAARRLELPAPGARSPRRRPVARAGVGRAPPGRLHPLLVRAAGLAHPAPLPVRRRRPRASPVPHVAALRRPRLHAAAPLDASRRSGPGRATRARWA